MFLLLFLLLHRPLDSFVIYEDEIDKTDLATCLRNSLSSLKLQLTNFDQVVK